MADGMTSPQPIPAGPAATREAGRPTPAVAGADAPRVWLLMGHKAGDNTQVLALGERLGWPFEVKRLVYTPYEIVVNLPVCSWLAGMEKDKSSALGPPWPDLVISAGRRNEPIARWIKKNADRRVRLVHLGRPWAAIERFDLVVTTPQYRLPKLANVLHNETPLHRVTEARLGAEAAAWVPRLAHLPRPFTALLAGGNSGPYPFDARSGEKLGRLASAFAAEAGGSLLLTTSARTRPGTVDALVGSITAPSYVFRWAPDAAENPYFAFLGLADSVIATADSISMMTEACATGKPVYLYDTGDGVTSMRSSPFEPTPLGDWRFGDKQHRKAFVYRQGMRFGPRRWTRDIRIIQGDLVKSGRAAWLGDDVRIENPPPLRDLERATARVAALFD